MLRKTSSTKNDLLVFPGRPHPTSTRRPSSHNSLDPSAAGLNLFARRQARPYDTLRRKTRGIDTAQCPRGTSCIPRTQTASHYGSTLPLRTSRPSIHTTISMRLFPAFWVLICAAFYLAPGAESETHLVEKYDTVLRSCGDLPSEVTGKVLVLAPISCEKTKVKICASHLMSDSTQDFAFVKDMFPLCSVQKQLCRLLVLC